MATIPERLFIVKAGCLSEGWFIIIDMSTSGQSANRQIARAAGTVMLAFVASNLIGLARQILMAGVFGTQAGMDAFSAANRVSETLFNLVAGGALASAFIPTFTGLLTRGDRQRAWRLASATANLILLILILACILAAVFAPWIVRNILAPGFANDPGKEALTISLLRVMLPSAVIFGLSGLVMGILNSNQVFFWPAFAPAMYQVGMIFGIIALAPSLGIYGLAIGVLIGSVLHLLLQLPSLWRLHGYYFPTMGWGSPDVNEVMRLMAPRLLGVAVVQLNFWINTRLASQFVEGSVITLVLAFSLMLMPQAAIAQSIAIAAMPTLSAQVALGKLDEMRASLATSLRWALLFSIPASVGLILLRKPVIVLLYQRGEFNSRSTELVAWALLWFVAGLVGHTFVEILSRAFYSLHDTLTPVVVGIAAMSLNVLFSYGFSALFIQLDWLPHGGLALANSLATGLEAGGLFLLMRHRLNGLNGQTILEGMAKATLATLAMGLCLWAWLTWTQGRTVWLVVSGGIVVGVVVFAASIALLGVSEFKIVLGAVKRRFAG
jgi:putative peptidoglycan lipid II flippase